MGGLTEEPPRADGGAKQGVVEELPDAEAEAQAEGEEGEDEEPEAVGKKTIVIHFGSQNLRIGFASDALPRTMPMVIAHQARESESEEHGGEPRPKRRKMDVADGSPERPAQLFSDEVGEVLCPRMYISLYLRIAADRDP